MSENFTDSEILVTGKYIAAATVTYDTKTGDIISTDFNIVAQNPGFDE